MEFQDQSESPRRSVLYVHHERGLGGAPLSLLFLIRKLDLTRWRPELICLREGPAAEMFRKEGLKVSVIEGPDLSHTELVWFRFHQWPRLVWRMWRSIPLFLRLQSAFRNFRKRDPEGIVHLNSSTLVTAALAARSVGLPVVWHIREPLVRGYLGVRRALLRRAINFLSARIISISQNDAEQLGRVSHQKLSVIYNFVDFEKFDAKLSAGKVRAELNISSSAEVVLFLGGSTRVKGADVLKKAISAVNEGNSSIHWMIAGEMDVSFWQDPSLEPYRTKVHVLGPRHDIPQLLADSSLLIFPSTVPHFARPIIESAAMARPVIASDLGGVRELVIRNETGILIPPCDHVSLANSVVDLLMDPARCHRLGQQALEMAKEKFNADRNACLTFQIYDCIFKQSS